LGPYIISAYVNDTFAASSASTTLTVQEEPIPYINSYPLPQEYWTRPIYGENTDWWSISSDYFGEGSPQQATKYIPDAAGPITSHVMWTKALQSGGVVGGDNLEIQGDTYFEGTSRLTRYRNPIILCGKIYFTEPVSYSGSGGPTDCVDLRTGELIWSRSDVPALSFGYIFKVKTVDNIGVIQPILFTRNFASAFDADTGAHLFDVTNVPSGTSAWGTNGEQLRYVMMNAGTSKNQDWYLAQWNSSKLWDYSGMTLTIDDIVDGGVADPNSDEYRYDWNVSIPWRNAMDSETWVTLPDLTISQGTSRPVTVIAAFYNDILLCRNGSLPTSGLALSGISITPYTYFAVNLNPAKGAIGSILWMKTYQPPADNINVFQGGFDPVSRVFVEFYKQTAQWVGYSMDTGTRLWTTASQTDINAFEYYGNIRSSAAVAQLAYGKLYSSGFGGICFCYDLETGDLLWTYGNGGPGNSTYAGFYTGTPYYTLYIDAIANGVVYLETTEHTVQTPIYKGALKRAINATDGTEIWTLSGWTSGGGGFPSYAVADGFATWFNGYDGQIYVVGRGPSATTVTASPKVTVHGSSVIIEGTVTDIAAGSKQKEQAARFPNGVPAVSDESMSDWMEYVYQQRPRPTDVTGVEVVLSVLDPNNNCYEVARTTSDANGFFKATFIPEVPGEYFVYATFEGSEGYWPSDAVTAINVEEAPAATPEPTPTPASMADLYLVPGIIGIIVAIAVVGAILVMMLRKR
jgi:outer membrane protein assembly factor BamB